MSKISASPHPWHTSGSHKPNGEAVYILHDSESTPIGTIRSDGLPPGVHQANRRLIEHAPRMQRVILECMIICAKNSIPVSQELIDLVHDSTGVDPREATPDLIVEP